MKHGNETGTKERGGKMDEKAAEARGLVDRLYAQAERFGDDPGQYFMALGRAKKALTDWQAAYPEAAAELAAENKARAAAEKAAREERCRTGYIARGLD